jgi:hypothetical protein
MNIVMGYQYSIPLSQKIFQFLQQNPPPFLGRLFWDTSPSRSKALWVFIIYLNITG